MHQLCACHFFPFGQFKIYFLIFDRTSKSVNTGNGSNYYNVGSREKRLGCRVTQAFYILIYHRFFFDVGIGNRHIRFRLIKIVVRNEIVHGIMREKIAVLGGELCRERFVVRNYKSRLAVFFNHICNCEGLSRTGNA